MSLPGISIPLSAAEVAFDGDSSVIGREDSLSGSEKVGASEAVPSSTVSVIMDSPKVAGEVGSELKVCRLPSVTSDAENFPDASNVRLEVIELLRRSELERVNSTLLVLSRLAVNGEVETKVAVIASGVHFPAPRS
jgi:hypothetical protein